MLSRSVRVMVASSMVAAGIVAALARAPQEPRATRQGDVDALLDRLVAAMTIDEKVALLHGAPDPQSYGQAGYLPGVPRLGIPALRLTDGPAGVRTSQPATALPAPVALAST